MFIHNIAFVIVLSMGGLDIDPLSLAFLAKGQNTLKVLNYIQNQVHVKMYVG